MAKKKQHKKQLYLIVAVVVLVIIAIPAMHLSYKGIGKPVIQPYAVSPTAMPTQGTSISGSPSNTSPIITEVNANTKKIVFPEYKVSFEIPSQYFSPSSDLHPESNVISIGSSDAKDSPSGKTLSGVAGTIRVYKGWNGFSNELPENQQYKNQFIIDNSILPTNNVLVTTTTARAYKGSYIEVKLETNTLIGYNGNFRLECSDLSFDRCPDIERLILSTLQLEK